MYLSHQYYLFGQVLLLLLLKGFQSLWALTQWDSSFLSFHPRKTKLMICFPSSLQSPIICCRKQWIHWHCFFLLYSIFLFMYYWVIQVLKNCKLETRKFWILNLYKSFFQRSQSSSTVKSSNMFAYNSASSGLVAAIFTMSL